MTSDMDAAVELSITFSVLLTRHDISRPHTWAAEQLLLAVLCGPCLQVKEGSALGRGWNHRFFEKP